MLSPVPGASACHAGPFPAPGKSWSEGRAGVQQGGLAAGTDRVRLGTQAVVPWEPTRSAIRGWRPGQRGWRRGGGCLFYALSPTPGPGQALWTEGPGQGEGSRRPANGGSRVATQRPATSGWAFPYEISPPWLQKYLVFTVEKLRTTKKPTLHKIKITRSAIFLLTI